METRLPNVGEPGRLAWVELPENRAAWQAVEGLFDHVRRPARRGAPAPPNPLFVHGPPGSGKTRLLERLAARVSGAGLDLAIAALPARDVAGEADAWRDADLVLVEDVQHLPANAVETMARLVDRCLSRGRPLVATATEGPAQLALPSRLTSRLAQGLVVALYPLPPASREAFLRQRTAALGVRLSDAVVAWVAEHTPGSARQLDGTLTRLSGLAAALGRPPEVDDVEAAFAAERPSLSIERIVAGVSDYYRVKPAELRSDRRSREVLLPRQVGMYLARELTALTLVEIGAYFGGRDHSTVLHACRKVADALTADATLSGAVRRLRAGLA